MLPLAEGDLELWQEIPIRFLFRYQLAICEYLDHRRPKAAQSFRLSEALAQQSSPEHGLVCIPLVGRQFSAALKLEEAVPGQELSVSGEGLEYRHAGSQPTLLISGG